MENGETYSQLVKGAMSKRFSFFLNVFPFYSLKMNVADIKINFPKPFGINFCSVRLTFSFVSQSYEPFYGARVFVVLSSGKRKLLK